MSGVAQGTSGLMKQGTSHGPLVQMKQGTSPSGLMKQGTGTEASPLIQQVKVSHMYVCECMFVPHGAVAVRVCEC